MVKFIKNLEVPSIALKICISVCQKYVFQLMDLHENFQRAVFFHCKNVLLEKCYLPVLIASEC